MKVNDNVNARNQGSCRNTTLLARVAQNLAERGAQVMHDEITVGGTVVGPRFKGDHDHLYDAKGIPVHG